VPDNRWESFAQENAEYFTCTADDVDFTTPEGRARVMESGPVDAARILADAEPYLTRRYRAVEIGCGIGRLTVPMARRFDEMVAVDIAPTMLDKLAEHARAAGVDNVHGYLAGQPWYTRGPADLVYSLLVFQHIENWLEIVRYVARIAACLAPDGLCYAQFDTRPATVPYQVRGHLPDPVLPRTWRRGIRRIRRSPAALVDLFQTSGLRVADERQPGTERHVFLLTRAPR
jgi:SAM-dependent methyltransferase